MLNSNARISVAVSTVAMAHLSVVAQPLIVEAVALRRHAAGFVEAVALRRRGERSKKISQSPHCESMRFTTPIQPANSGGARSLIGNVDSFCEQHACSPRAAAASAWMPSVGGRDGSKHAG